MGEPLLKAKENPSSKMIQLWEYEKMHVFFEGLFTETFADQRQQYRI